MMKLMKFGEVSPAEIFARAVPEMDVSAVVADILREVRTRGDAALLEYNERFEGAKLDALEVSKAEMDAALRATDPAFLAILERAAANIRAFHSKQMRSGFRMDLCLDAFRMHAEAKACGTEFSFDGTGGYN